MTSAIEAVLSGQKQWTVAQGDCREVLAAMPDGCVQMVCCSPPYRGLRDYGLELLVWGGDENCAHEWGELLPEHHPGQVNQSKWANNDAVAKGQTAGSGSFCRLCGAWRGSLGLEPDVASYIAHLVEVFREVKRVLRDDGTCWVVIAGSYASTAPGTYNAPQPKGSRSAPTQWANFRPKNIGFKPKDYIDVPGMLGRALQADGWWWRGNIIWSKGLSFCKEYSGACMPESVQDRPTRSFEHVLLLSKSKTYFYDQDAERETSVTNDPRKPYGSDGAWQVDGRNKWEEGAGQPQKRDASKRNLRSVWAIPEPYFRWRDDVDLATRERVLAAYFEHVPPESLTDVWAIGTKGLRLKHYAAFPPALVSPMIRLGSSERGACPECGKGWERVVTKGLTAHDGKTDSSYAKGTTANRLALLRQAARERGQEYASESRTLGWRPQCICGMPEGMKPDDLEIINSPIGERAGEDPTMRTGRAGLNRPRGENEGTRPITRYEQRLYAIQLRESGHRAEMAIEAGSAFEHYVRTDRAGARPTPVSLLEVWIERGWLQRIDVPQWIPPEPVPCVVLDPFCGSGTAIMQALRLGRRAIGVDLSEEYVAMSRRRVVSDCPMMNVPEPAPENP